MTSELPRISHYHNRQTPGGLEVSNNMARKTEKPKVYTALKEPRVNMFTADHYPHVSEAEMELNSAVSELNEHILSVLQQIS